MSTCCSNFHSSLYTLLSFHISKVEIIRILVFIEFLARVNNGRFKVVITIKKIDNIGEIIHTIDLQIIYHGCFTGIFLWYNHTFKVIFLSADSNRQNAANRLYFPVKA